MKYSTCYTTKTHTRNERTMYVQEVQTELQCNSTIQWDTCTYVQYMHKQIEDNTEQIVYCRIK